jgi:hypothetical protein
MAVITPTLGPITGKLGGVSFQASPYGNILKTKSQPTKFTTARQNSSHKKQQEFINAWQLLNVDTRASWNAFAAANPYFTTRGISRTVSGFNYFIGLNRVRQLAALAVLTIPPVYSAQAAPPSVHLNIDTIGLSITLTGSLNLATHTLLLYCSRFYSSISKVSSVNMGFCRRFISYGGVYAAFETSYEQRFDFKYYDQDYKGSLFMACKIIVIQNSTGLISVPAYSISKKSI